MNFPEKIERINFLKDKALKLTVQYPAYAGLGNVMADALEEKKGDSSLRVVFVGQYSSGKSSIISALTGNSSIRIDSDIATDKTEDYQWRSVTLTDTPGISAGRTDHDSITHEKIKQADLLVYVVTYSLFDNVLIEDFKRLSIDYNYKSKMLLVVNKMYSEDGEYEDLCDTYMNSLNNDIGVDTLKGMPVSFVSSGNALDEDPDFHEFGHMDDLIDKLEALIEKNQSLAGFEAVAQIVATNIEEDLANRSEGTTKDEQQLLQRVEKAVERVKRDAQSCLDEEVSNVRSLSRGLGSECAALVGASETLKSEVEQASESLNNSASQSFNSLSDRFAALDKELDSELEELYESSLAKRYFSDFSDRAAQTHVDGNISITEEDDHAVANKLSELFGKGSNSIAAMSSGAKAGSGLLSSSGASGSSVHQAVLSVGKAMGVKFQPWQAVNIAKNIGNVTKVLGPVLAALPVFLEVYDIIQEEKRNKELADGRRNIRHEFQNAGASVVEQMKKSGNEYIEGKYGALLREISAMRRVRIRDSRNLEEGGLKLKEVSEELRSIL